MGRQVLHNVGDPTQVEGWSYRYWETLDQTVVLRYVFRPIERLSPTLNCLNLVEPDPDFNTQVSGVREVLTWMR